MAVRIANLGRTTDAEVEEVLEGGRVLVAGGRRFTLRPLTGQWVAEGEPYYGPRLLLGPAPPRVS
jgi:hypothetical protein